MRAERGWEFLPEGWEKLVGPPGGQEGLVGSSWKAGRGWESHLEGRGGQEYPQEGREDWEVHQ